MMNFDLELQNLRETVRTIRRYPKAFETAKVQALKRTGFIWGAKLRKAIQAGEMTSQQTPLTTIGKATRTRARNRPALWRLYPFVKYQMDQGDSSKVSVGILGPRVDKKWKRVAHHHAEARSLIITKQWQERIRQKIAKAPKYLQKEAYPKVPKVGSKVDLPKRNPVQDFLKQREGDMQRTFESEFKTKLRKQLLKLRQTA